MKRWSSVLAVSVASAMLATTVYAQTGGSGGAGTSGTGGSSSGGATTGSPATGMDKANSEKPPSDRAGSSSTSPSAGPSGSSMGASTSSADYTGRHTMEGEVTRIDQKKGHVTIKTAAGNMDLHFPPSALQNVKKGDHISVELAMKPSGSASMGGSSPSASPKTDKSDSGTMDKSNKKY
jgi:hypothetical protein